MYDLQDRTALITGGANGIGRATAAALVAYGVNVVIGDMDADKAANVAEQLGPTCSSEYFNATDAESVRSLVQAAHSRLGSLNILHNNVAMTTEAWSKDTTVLDTDLEVWDRTMHINLRSMFVASKAALPYMLEHGQGSIINMSSVAGMAGAQSLVAYGTSKAAVSALTKYLAVQYGAQGVRANCIAPGTILTQQLLDNAGGRESEALDSLPSLRLGEPEDVANLVAFLASEKAAFVNGETLTCDGGRQARSSA